MQLNQETSNARYQIKQYQPGCITVNAQDYNHSLLIMPESIAPWPVANLAELSVQHILELCALQPELILLGSGQYLTHLPTEFIATAAAQNIGLEIMTTTAACRTFTLLSSENRNVLAALII